MLDLNNVTLNSLLTFNIDDQTTESESLIALKDDQLPDDSDSLIDPGAFVLLLAQITANIPQSEKNDTVESELINLVETESVKEDNTNTAVTNSMEDNVAVAWISSEYYQAEFNAEHTSIAATEGEPIISESGKEQDIHASAAIENTTKILDEIVLERPQNAISELVPVIHDNERNLFSLNQIEEQKNINLVDLITQQTPLKESDMENKAEIKLNLVDNNILTKSKDPVNEFFQEDDSIANKIQVNSPFEASKTKEDLSSDEDLISVDVDLIENNNLPKAKTNPNAEMQVKAPLIDSGVKDADQVNNIISNPIANNINQTHFAANQNDAAKFSVMPETFTIPTDIDHPEWSQQFSDHVIWLGQQGMKSALIKIHPEELGPLEISIKVVNESASLNIISHSQHVREIIDQTMPQLQKMMEEQGLNLSEVTIKSDTDAGQFERQNKNPQEEIMHHVEEEEVITPVKNKITPKGVIDYFA